MYAYCLKKNLVTYCLEHKKIFVLVFFGVSTKDNGLVYLALMPSLPAIN